MHHHPHHPNEVRHVKHVQWSQGSKVRVIEGFANLGSISKNNFWRQSRKHHYTEDGILGMCVLGPLAKNWHLTGRFDTAEDPREIFDATTMRFMVGQHELTTDDDGKENHHWQVFLQYERKVRATCVLKLFPGAHWRNSVMRKTVPDGITYCTKEDTFVSDRFELGKVPTTKGKRSCLADAIHSLQVEGKGKVWLAKNNATASILFGSRIDNWLPLMRAETLSPRFKLDEFKWDPITDWSKSHILWGDSGIGKTNFAHAHFKNPLFLSHIDGLKGFDKSFHDGIIFDDMNFDYWPHDPCIHITDIDFDRQINVKCTVAVIPKNTRKIFTTNHSSGLIFKDQHEYQIQRRIQVHHLKGPRFGVPAEQPPPPKRRKPNPPIQHSASARFCDCPACLLANA